MRRKNFWFMLTVLLCLLSFSLTAMAQQGPTCSTTTAYRIDEGKIEVRSTVSNVPEGEQITYLAFTGDVPDNETIVYIDQAEAGSDGTHTFVYVTSSSNISSTIKFGGTYLDTAEEAGSIPNPDFPKVKVVIDGEGKVNGNSNDYTSVDACSFTFEPGENYYLSSVIVNGKSVTDEIIGGYTFDNTDEDNELHVGFEANDIDTITTGEAAKGSSDEGKYITLFATANAAYNAEYGILISTDASENDTLKVDNQGVTQLKALGKGTTGQFAVKVVDNTGKFLKTGETYYVRPYLKSGEDYIYGEIKNITLNEE